MPARAFMFANRVSFVRQQRLPNFHDRLSCRWRCGRFAASRANLSVNPCLNLTLEPTDSVTPGESDWTRKRTRRHVRVDRGTAQSGSLFDARKP